MFSFSKALILGSLTFFCCISNATAQYESYAYCKEKLTGKKADPKTGKFINLADENQLYTSLHAQFAACVNEIDKNTNKKFDIQENKNSKQTDLANKDTSKPNANNFDAFIGELSCGSGPTMGPFKKDISGNFKNNVSNFFKTTSYDNNSNQNNEEYFIKIIGEVITLEAIYKFPDRVNNINLKGNLNSKNLNDNILKGVMTGSKAGGGILRECEAILKIKGKNLNTGIINTANTSFDTKQNLEQYLKKDIDFTGIMECGPYIGRESTWGNYSRKIIGTLHDGKATITQKWKEGYEDGENILSLIIDKSGKTEITGKEVISSSMGTFYKNYNFSGTVQNNSNTILVNGKKYENGRLIRECKINLAFSKTPSGNNQKNNVYVEKNIEIEKSATSEIDKKNKKDTTDIIKAFLSNKIHYYGVFSCGPRIDNNKPSNPVPAYNDNTSGDLENGKSLITMSWGGNDPGYRNLNLNILYNGTMSLKGIEKTFQGNTTYNLSGNLNINNNQAELNGAKYDDKNVALRKCSLVINFMKTPEEYYNGLIANNTNEKKLIDLNVKKNEEIGSKEKEIERIAAIEIEKNRQKEEAKAAELSRLAAIDAEKQKQREAEELKAKANREAKEKEIERLAALEVEKKRQKEEAEARAKVAEANRLAAIETEKQKQREAAEAKAKAEREAEIERLAALEIVKKRQKEEAEQKERAAKEAELIRLAAIEAEKQKKKEAVAARVAAIEAEKQRQKDIADAKEKIEKEKEIERLAVLEIEKKRIREEREAAAKAEILRLAAIEAENKRQREEAEAKAKAQRLVELENEMKKLRGDTQTSKPTAQVKQETTKNDNDPLSAFEGTWVSVSPPVFYLIFNKVALGIRQVSLPNIGQGNIKLSDGAHGSNFQISAANLNCYYFVTFTNNRQKMIMELKAGESLCLQSSILEKAE